MNFGSKHLSISDASLAFSRQPVYLLRDCQWFKEICFKKWLHVLMQFGKLFTLQIQIHKKKIHENTEDMFEDFLNCNKYSAFF